MFPTTFASHQKAIGTPILGDVATSRSGVQPVGFPVLAKVIRDSILKDTQEE